jgi:hypothetical protein
MKRHDIRRAMIAASAALPLVLHATKVHAQDVTGRVAMEAVASISMSSADDGKPFLMFDQISTVGVGRGWDVIVRPWARRMPAGDWSAQMYQLQMRYTSSTRIPFRFDAGVISSPLGLTTLELKADQNPTIGAPFYYFVPLPPFDGNFDRVTIMSGGYPLGAIFTTSGGHWDLRGGMTDATPARARSVFSSTKAPAAPQFVMGGGVTPTTGLRFGGGVAVGRYRVDAVAQKNLTIPDDSYYPSAPATGVIPRGTPIPDETATVFNVEGEYAVGYTRVSGELIVDRFETLISPAVARGFNLVAVRTLTPRWFTAGRIVGASTPILTTPTPVRRVGKSAEATIGYRLTPTITLRAAYQGSRGFGAATWMNAVAVSTVWAQRWW